MQEEKAESSTRQNDRPRSRSWSARQAISIFIMGIGIGWLTGLSVSPVVSGVIASLLGIGSGALLGIRAIRGGDDQKTAGQLHAVDCFPAALFVLGIALAAPAGIVARTHGVFGPISARSPGTAIEQPESGDTSQDQLAQRILMHAAERVPGLYAVSSNECGELLALYRKDPQMFVGMLKNSSLPRAEQFVSRVRDPKTLQTIVEILCTAE